MDTTDESKIVTEIVETADEIVEEADSLKEKIAAVASQEIALNPRRKPIRPESKIAEGQHMADQAHYAGALALEPVVDEGLAKKEVASRLASEIAKEHGGRIPKDSEASRLQSEADKLLNKARRPEFAEPYLGEE
ncbi:hypothetical protein HK104_010736 [Borealophlyctis nickersoniae]|nr:hypothetical protein HK104_010736 [Borealophlyctis nickersoniae]